MKQKDKKGTVNKREPPSSTEKYAGNNNSNHNNHDENDSDEPQYPGKLKLTLIILILSLNLAMFLVGLDSSIISPAVPKITDHFHALGDVGWYASAYHLTNCAFQLMWGKLYMFYVVK